jgi:hypothetical protein
LEGAVIHWKHYLADDALTEPEDFRAFIASFGNSAWTGDVLRALDERLDRERRQACRRGALESWRLVRVYVRIARDEDPTWWGAPNLAHYLQSTIEFRREARRP